MDEIFKRVNFFKGLFMKTEDWKKEQQYHREKQRFHNKYLHTPGVVSDCLERLRVTVSETGNKLIIAPGYAIDGEGRDLYVPIPKEIDIPDLQSFNPPTTIYISIRYTENLEDKRKNEANPMYEDFAYAVEETQVEITGREPDNHNSIELARVRLSENAGRIRNAGTPAGAGNGALPVPVKPGTGKAVVPLGTRTDRHRAGAEARDMEPGNQPGFDEIDMSRVLAAGAITSSRTDRLSLSHLGDKLIDTRISVIAWDRKQEDTNILIEQYPKPLPPPLYLVFVQSLDGVRTRWSVECTENDQGTMDYTLHVRNESNRPTTIMCRVYRIRV